jgi:hypothetical protein
MTKTVCIYHRADFDGIFCREIARKFLPPDTEFIGWDYGDPTPNVPPDCALYILDLSVDALMDHGGLVWIDHHKSAIEKYSHDIKGYRIDGVAACRLAWFYFTALERYKAQTETADFTWFQGHYPWATKQDFVDRKVSEPYAVQLAGEYDIWDKRDPNAEVFQHGLRSRELTAEDWSDLLRTDSAGAQVFIVELLDAGSAIQYAKTQENADIIRAYGFTVHFEGLTFLACNHARFNSLLFTAGLKPEHDALLGFNYTGSDWRVSLYHAPGKEHHDLSKIAVKYGGGGHRGACGFRLARLPFLLTQP